ncbi:putative TonB-dependent receptor [Flavihumibacter petaseus NBRC 106054]|uniref:Putative TonB-dependent receptor n=1 Tax=Flavihumibacter petaseus NBRC 106054 TaxID=1220578 RepID=A0A0E9N597_9BACT|nr:putative TonB-dependent receptor [Flavihumibacter petaseus NBRC 106054]
MQAFSIRAGLRELPAAVGLVRLSDWRGYSPATILPAINALPGVRMEERSPASYRLAMRGSALRSPFGVRNIRFYLDDVPFTDPGGNTYLNCFPLSFLGNLELLRGPAGSHYGAGTGGVVLAGNNAKDTVWGNSLNLQYTTGSYGLHQVDVAATTGKNGWSNQLLFQHQQSDGYRNQTAMRRDAISWQSVVQQREKSTLAIRMLYSDLQYETPGGLTLAQYREDPKQARPAAGIFPSAEAAKAAIYQRLFFAGLHQHWEPLKNLSTDLSVYGAFAAVENPSIRNYEKRSEPHAGARLSATGEIPLGNTTLKWSAGGEYQSGWYNVNVYGNNAGLPDTLQTSDAVRPRNAFLFTQATWQLRDGWQLMGEVSWNNNLVAITRQSIVPNIKFTSNYRGEWAPRFSLLKKWRGLTTYLLAAKGFSPPSTGELLPSNSIINNNLQAEWGWNYEAGLRGNVIRGKGWFELNFFYFALHDAIVQRRDASGADYFDNAGDTRQKGIEASFRYPLLMKRQWRLNYRMSYTLSDFHYKDFIQVDHDYSGNELPGVAKQVVNAGLFVNTLYGQALAVTYQYCDPIWLNDANTDKAAPFHLLGARLSSTIGKYLEVFAGADNLFNTTYSLGNDINAAAGRYYNAAYGRNYYAGLRFSLSSRRYQGSEEK